MDEQNINPEPEHEPGEEIKEHIKPEQRDWKPVVVPKKPAEVKPEPKLEPESEAKLRYSGNMQEFRYAAKKELRKDIGTRLSKAEQADMTKMYTKRGGKYLGSRKEKREIREYGQEHGWTQAKIRRMISEGRNLKRKTRGSS